MAKEIEIVTAYFHIPSKNPKEFYLKNAEKMLCRVKTPITLFSSKEFAEIFKKMRGNLPLTLVIDDLDTDGLPKDMPIKFAFDDGTWQKILETLLSRSQIIKTFSVQLLQLWLSKAWFVQRAISLLSVNEETANKVFMWNDIGASKNITDITVFDYWPSPQKLFLRGYDDNKIIFYQRRNRVELVPNLEAGIGSVIAGSTIIGTTIAWKGVFEDVIKQTKDHATKFHYDGIIDETVYYGLVIAQPEKYRMERVYWVEPPLYNYGWYETFYQDIDIVNPLLLIENEKKNIFTVKNFLNLHIASNMALDLKNIDKTWWSISMFPSDANNTKLIERYSYTLEKDQEFQNKRSFNKAVFNQGNFSYLFKRSAGGHYPSCSCIMCSLPKHFSSKEFKYALSSIVGEEVTELNETFCSKYEKGDYLSIHHDKGKGDYAFVFQLTEDWNPSFGGLLHFYDSDSKQIYKTVNPMFNSLTIFKIKNVPITDHFVSENTSDKIRYAFTGWFSVKNAQLEGEENKEKQLTILANHFKSDKGDQYKCAHHYTKHYADIFKDKLFSKKFSLLEFGLNRDNCNDVPSLQIYKHFFGSLVDISGYDINPGFQKFTNEGFHIYIGDQSSKQHLIGPKTKSYEIIIDDASHASSHQQITLMEMWECVVPGGYYVIEDLFWQPFTENIIKTADLIENWIQGNFIAGDIINIQWVKQFQNSVDYIKLLPTYTKTVSYGKYNDLAFAVIKKK